MFFLFKTKNIHFIKKCLDENLYILFKQTILHYNIFSISRIFWWKKRIFDLQKCFFFNQNKRYSFLKIICELKFAKFIQASNFAFCRFFHISRILVEKSNFYIFKSIFFKTKQKISYKKMCECKFVELI